MLTLAGLLAGGISTDVIAAAWCCTLKYIRMFYSIKMLCDLRTCSRLQCCYKDKEPPKPTSTRGRVMVMTILSLTFTCQSQRLNHLPESTCEANNS